MSKTAVLILFFTRYAPLKAVFESVKKYKPEKLYLFQDGPRKNRPDDISKIERCRTIFDDIDWECEVHTHYCEENMGCDPAEYAAISWALETEEKIIRLEDDNVASESFFPFCDEMLEKYKNDRSIFLISGRNRLGSFNWHDYSYLFSSSACIGGIATWKDRWSMVDTTHEFLLDQNTVKDLISRSKNKYNMKKFLQTCRNHREKTLIDGKPASYESPIQACLHLYSMFEIVPTKNLIQNNGNIDTEDAVHTPISMDYVLPEDRWVFDLPLFNLEFPLNHPTKVECNDLFDKKIYKRLSCYSWIGSKKHVIRQAINRRIVDYRKRFQ